MERLPFDDVDTVEDDTDPAKGLYRPGDPETSREAAEYVDVNRLEGMVLEAIQGFGPEGCISDQVREALPTLSYSSVTARYVSLIDKGKVRRGPQGRVGNSGRKQMIMWAS